MKGLSKTQLEIYKTLDETKKQIITAILIDKIGKYYILDLINFTNFEQYYIFELDKQKLNRYLNSKNRLDLYPNEEQQIYKVLIKDFNFETIEVLDICDPMKIFLSFYDENWLKD